MCSVTAANSKDYSANKEVKISLTKTNPRALKPTAGNALIDEPYHQTVLPFHVINGLIHDINVCP